MKHLGGGRGCVCVKVSLCCPRHQTKQEARNFLLPGLASSRAGACPQSCPGFPQEGFKGRTVLFSRSAAET